jgi:Flp pilus assembly protein TadD
MRAEIRRRFLKRGRELIDLGQHQRARDQLTRALKMADDGAVRELLALSHQRAGELWPAVHHLQKAAERSTGARKARCSDNLGVVYLQLGKKTEACRAFRAALMAAPGFPAAQRHLEARCGKSAQAAPERRK